MSVLGAPARGSGRPAVGSGAGGVRAAAGPGSTSSRQGSTASSAGCLYSACGGRPARLGRPGLGGAGGAPAQPLPAPHLPLLAAVVQEAAQGALQVRDGRPQPLLHGAGRGERRAWRAGPGRAGQGRAGTGCCPPPAPHSRPVLTCRARGRRSAAPAAPPRSPAAAAWRSARPSLPRGAAAVGRALPSPRRAPGPRPPAPALTGVGRGVHRHGLGPGAPAAPVPRPHGPGPHLGAVAGARPQVQDLSPGRPRDLQDLRDEPGWGRGCSGPRLPRGAGLRAGGTFQSGLLPAV